VCPGSTTCRTVKRAYACKHSTAWVNNQQGICVQKLHSMHEQLRRERQRRARTAPPAWKPDTMLGHDRAKDTSTKHVLGSTHCATVATHNPHLLQSTTVHTHTKLETQVCKLNFCKQLRDFCPIATRYVPRTATLTLKRLVWSSEYATDLPRPA
jgi:hypothetical protein